MKSFRTLIALPLLVLAVSGCRTISVNSLISIPVPSTMSPANAKAALMLATEKNFETPAWVNWEKVADTRPLAAAVGEERESKRDSEWFVEDVEPDGVLYGLRNDDDYVRIRMTIRGNRIIPTIDGSKHLRREGDQIDKDVGDWYDDLEIMIRKAIGRVSMLTQSQPPK